MFGNKERMNLVVELITTGDKILLHQKRLTSWCIVMVEQPVSRFPKMGASYSRYPVTDGEVSELCT
jgi:hypothetical protein